MDLDEIDLAVVDWKATAENLHRELRRMQMTARRIAAQPHRRLSRVGAARRAAALEILGENR